MPTIGGAVRETTLVVTVGGVIGEVVKSARVVVDGPGIGVLNDDWFKTLPTVPQNSASECTVLSVHCSSISQV